MTINYVMSKTHQGVTDALAARSGCGNLWLLACTLTDLKGPEYVGPYPEPGEFPIKGEIHAYSPSQSTIIPRSVRIPVWVAAYEEPTD